MGLVGLTGLSALGRNRTCDQEIRRLLLYPLSYEGSGSRIVGRLETFGMPRVA